MKTKSLYIASQEINAGILFTSMGMMEVLKRNLPRVAYFRPIIYDRNKLDGDINFILTRYSLDIEYEDAYGFDVAYIESMIAQNKTNLLLNQLIQKFKKLESEYDFILCEGIRHSFLSSNIHYDFNLKIAHHFNTPYINIVNAKTNDNDHVIKNIQMEYDNLKKEGCTHFATFVNRVSDESYEPLKDMLEKLPYTTYILKEVAELNFLTLEDVVDSLAAKEVLVSKEDYSRTIRGVKVAGLTLDNFLEHIEEDDLVIVPADRSDIILGLLGALYSDAYPNVSAIVFPFDMQAHKNIQKLIVGLDSFNIPLISVKTDTYTTAKNISKTRARLRLHSSKKIALSLGVFNASIDIEEIEKKIKSSHSEIISPLMFEYNLFEMARKTKRTIVLPESEDERILRAVETVLLRDVVEIILLGDEKKIVSDALRLGLDISKARFVSMKDEKLLQEFSEEFYQLRKAKGISHKVARDAITHRNYFATMMVHLGYADGMVSGAVGSTGETIRPALQIIRTKPDTKIVSSVFFMCMEKEVLVYGDCAINKDPNAEELAQIALSSVQTAKAFAIEPKVAMLSYSTGESGSGAEVEKVREATKIVRERASELAIEGPIQYDAAINEAVAKKKLPSSKVAGHANLFIFPDLNTGNNTYKAVQRSSGAVAIGPVLQGLNKPVNDLSRGCLVADIVNTIAITAIQVGE